MTSLDTQSTKYKGTFINADKMKRFLNLLYMHFIIKDSYVQIHAVDIKKILGGNYKNYLRYMVRNNLIKVNESYRTGEFTKRYKISAIKLEEINTMLETLCYAETVQDDLNDVYRYVIDFSKRITINYAEAINYANTPGIFNKAKRPEHAKEMLIYAINSIRNRNFFAKVDTRGRLYTNIISIKREVRREHIRLDGERLYEVDISNSQCYFLHLWMKKMNVVDEVFADDVINGTIYTKIMEYFGYSKKEAKTKVYIFIFGRNYKIDAFFKVNYPKACKFLNSMKKEFKSYKEVSHVLQKDEADFMFGVVAPILIEKGIEFTTIHDAVLVKQKHHSETSDILNRELKKLLG